MEGERYKREDWLREKYVEEGMYATDIAEIEGVSSTTIYSWMDRFGIDRREPGTVKERFWEKVDVCGPEECWEWQAGDNGEGYGVFWPHHTDNWLAHRFMYKLATGEDPGEMDVLHDCDNPPCVNPGHLHSGDHSDNMQEAYDRERNTRPSGEMNGRSKLTEDEVRVIKDRLEDETAEQVSDDYDVSSSTIGSISAGETWENV